MWRVVLALFLSLALLLTIPGTALGQGQGKGKPQSLAATGTIDSISPGNVLPAGESGRWRVVERELDGELYEGDISGDFHMAYKANVELETQAGNLHGTLKIGEYVLKVNGKIEPLEFEGWLEPGIPLYKLTISGHWTFIEGATGQGTFDAWVIFIPTPEGHIYAITSSSFTLDGKWQPH